ncbi:MAG TPA: CGNR zinc finger domain-containing protein [Solirubrobacteraceae bacterium]|nr:CGNR zinc finger domain-containing protein [Solirubrobacteraceae bacterium]
MSQEAPGRLELVREFVNSVDLEDGPEQLDSPGALSAWLRERSLLPCEGSRSGDATDADLKRAIDLREALRVLLLAHHADTDEPPASAVGVVESAARRARLELRFLAPSAAAHAVPARAGVDGALGELLAIVAVAQADGTWDRLKACPWDTCKWAFYDHSRNRSGVWCSMKVCGNRAKAASFRQRRRADTHGAT